MLLSYYFAQGLLLLKFRLGGRDVNSLSIGYTPLYIY